MVIQLLLFLLGLVLIVKGGSSFVDAASWMARVSGIPQFIIGATIVSVATTLPELIVSLTATSQGKLDMAVGNAVGSVTANTGLILAIAVLFLTIAAQRKQYLGKGILLLGAMVVVYLASRTGTFQVWGSIVLLVIFVLFLVDNLRGAKAVPDLDVEKPTVNRRNVVTNVLKFALGAAAMVVGSRLLVNSGSELAALVGIPEGVVAVTLVAIGTSLPELVTTITAIVKRQSGLSVGNVVGANIIDLALILPLCSLVSGGRLGISQQSIRYDMPACLILLVVALLPMLIRQKFSKVQGVALFALYAGYLWLIL